MKKNGFGYSIIKLLKIKDKKKIFNTAREKNTLLPKKHQ